MASEPTTPMSAEYVLRLLGDVLAADTAIVEEAPMIREVRWQQMPVRKGGSYYNAARKALTSEATTVLDIPIDPRVAALNA